MKRVRVIGRVECRVAIILEVENNTSLEEILGLAECEFGGVQPIHGHEGSDKMIGVEGLYETIECEKEVEFFGTTTVIDDN